MDKQAIRTRLDQALEHFEAGEYGQAVALLPSVLTAISQEYADREGALRRVGRLNWRVADVYRQLGPFLEQPDGDREIPHPDEVRGRLEAARGKALDEIQPLETWRTVVEHGRPEPMTEVVLCVLPFERPLMMVAGFYSEGPTEADGTPTWFTAYGSFHECQVACWLPVPKGWESLIVEDTFRSKWNRSRVQALGEAHLWDACSEHGQIEPLCDEAGQEIGLSCSGCNWQEMY